MFRLGSIRPSSGGWVDIVAEEEGVGIVFAGRGYSSVRGWGLGNGGWRVRIVFPERIILESTFFHTFVALWEL